MSTTEHFWKTKIWMKGTFWINCWHRMLFRRWQLIKDWIFKHSIEAQSFGWMYRIWFVIELVNRPHRLGSRILEKKPNGCRANLCIHSLCTQLFIIFYSSNHTINSNQSRGFYCSASALNYYNSFSFAIFKEEEIFSSKNCKHQIFHFSFF